MRLILPLVLAAALTGCGFSTTPTPDIVRSCTPPTGSYLSAFDKNGDLEWDPVFASEDDGSATLGICDGAAYRQVRVIGLQEGLASEHQDGFAVDGARHVIKELLLVTTSRELVTLPGLDLKGQCVKYCKPTEDATSTP